MNDNDLLENYTNTILPSRQMMISMLAILSQQESTIQTIVAARRWRRRETSPHSEWRRRAGRPVIGNIRDVPIQIIPIDISSNTTENLLFSHISATDRYASCPITYEEFDDDSEITRIRHCGHYFSRPAITRWLSTNNCCPICRHNIRPDAPTPTTPTPNTILEQLITLLNAESEHENNSSVLFHFGFEPTTNN